MRNRIGGAVRHKAAFFTSYFAKNYKFGHHLWKEIQNAPDVRTARTLARNFFARQEDAGERF